MRPKRRVAAVLNGLADNWLGQADQLLRRPAAEVVDPIVRIRCQPDLSDPWPKRLRRGVHGDCTPGLQSWRGDKVVAWIVAADLIVRHVPTIADHRARAVFKGSTSTTRPQRLVVLSAMMLLHNVTVSSMVPSAAPTEPSSVETSLSFIESSVSSRDTRYRVNVSLALI
jgi:hypothetical protein